MRSTATSSNTRKNKFRIGALCLAVLLNITTTALSQNNGPTTMRQAAFAGSFYPSSSKLLTAELDGYFKLAKAASFDGKVRTLIVPHAGYEYSGLVAASAYKSIPADTKYRNIFIIASSSREKFKGASVYRAGNYLSPLGEAKVNRQVARQLIEGSISIDFLPGAHEREHKIEVQLPFIQHHFTHQPLIVPIVLGNSSLSAARDLAAALLPWFTPENLFIISSDFSQYPAYQDARRIDSLSAEAILTKDPESFYLALRKSSEAGVTNLVSPSSGWSSIMTMLYMAERHEEIQLSPLLYRNSGDVPPANKERVVGYWAIAGHEKAPETTALILGEKEKEKLLAISRNTLETFLNSGTLEEVDPGPLSRTLKQPKGVFVSLYMGGRLRGRTGVFTSDKALYLAVQEMTLAAALNDPDFARVEASELEYLSIEITVLSPMQRIYNPDKFQPHKQGIYMRKGDQWGTLLPQEAPSADWSVEEVLGYCARDKAGLAYEGWKEAELFVYDALIFGEE